jgi:hypothetical protein
MAVHQITLTNEQEKALAITTNDYNAPLLKQQPPGRTQTEDEYFITTITPALDAMVTQAFGIQKAPIIDELQKVLDAGDTTKLDAVRAALGIAKL